MGLMVACKAARMSGRQTAVIVAIGQNCPASTDRAEKLNNALRV